jgi:hypothetical protein
VILDEFSIEARRRSRLISLRNGAGVHARVSMITRIMTLRSRGICEIIGK